MSSFQDPDTQRKTKNPLKIRKAKTIPQKNAAVEGDIVVKYLDGHEEVFLDPQKDQDHSTNSRTRRQVDSLKGSNGEVQKAGLPGAGADLPQESIISSEPHKIYDGTQVENESVGTIDQSDDDVIKLSTVTDDEVLQGIVTSDFPIRKDSDSQSTEDYGVNAAEVLSAMADSKKTPSVETERPTGGVDGAGREAPEAETVDGKAEWQVNQHPSAFVLSDTGAVPTDSDISLRQYYQDLLNYYSLYKSQVQYPLPDSITGATGEGSEQKVPHYYVVYPYGSQWIPGRGSSTRQNIQNEDPVSEGSENSVEYRLTLDRLQAAMGLPLDKVCGEINDIY